MRNDRVEEYLKQCSEHHAVRFEEECEGLMRGCESPIEKLLMIAFVLASKDQPFTSIYVEDMREEFPSKPPFDEAAFIYPQVKIGPYRVDFAIWDASIPLELAEPRIMIIECDGHDFHEKTKEQAKRDKKRDRYFQSRGFKVLHYTGSEIWANPSEIADEIINELACDDDWRSAHK